MSTKAELINLAKEKTSEYSDRELQRMKKADLEKLLNNEKDAIQEQPTAKVDVQKQPETSEKVAEKVPSKIEEKTPSDKLNITRSVDFYNRPDTVRYEHNREKHLVRYLNVERYWSLQQVEICLKDNSVTLVVDGTNPGQGRYLEFPKKTKIVMRNKERRPCIGCGRK